MEVTNNESHNSNACNTVVFFAAKFKIVRFPIICIFMYISCVFIGFISTCFIPNARNDNNSNVQIFLNVKNVIAYRKTLRRTEKVRVDIKTK